MEGSSTSHKRKKNDEHTKKSKKRQHARANNVENKMEEKRSGSNEESLGVFEFPWMKESMISTSLDWSLPESMFPVLDDGNEMFEEISDVRWPVKRFTDEQRSIVESISWAEDFSLLFSESGKVIVFGLILIWVLTYIVNMLLVSPACRGVYLQTIDPKPIDFSARASYALCFQIPTSIPKRECLMRLGTVFCFNQKHREQTSFKKRYVSTQNVDLPPILPKNKKKPYPIPFKQIQEEARKDKKLAQMGIEKQLDPPKNGLLVPNLVPVADQVIDNWKLLIKGLAQLLHVVPVFACSECGAVHVANVGHNIRDCNGPTNSQRRGSHSWVKGTINDVLIPVESYHMYDPFGRRIKHETRFEYERIPALVELCIQAGVEIPEYPCRRRTQPIRMMGKRVIDRGGYHKEPEKPQTSSSLSSPLAELDTLGVFERYPPPTPEDIPKIAQETMDAYEKVRLGVTKLMRKFTVKACGYCSEVHVGPWGHSVKLCGEFKHQWRDGKHGWQDALVDEVFPPNYVWHVRDLKGNPLTGNLRRFYGKAPALVEICMHSGARVPQRYKAMMRLDIIVPDSQEADMVA